MDNGKWKMVLPDFSVVHYIDELPSYCPKMEAAGF
jgi:hypothetical protein